MKTITTSFYTTTNIHSFWDVWKYILKIKKKNYTKIIENKLLKYLNLDKNTKILSFYNGRSALYHGLNLLGIKEGDEILMQAYTCVSVPNSIIHTGAKPIYIDIDETLNMDPSLIESKINKKTKAIVIQHTFGNPANICKIKEICKKYNIILIEDCAHSLGAEYKGKKIGTFGDLSFFSFGRDKIISTVNGGFLIVNNPKYINGINDIKKNLKKPGSKLIIQNMFYLIISYLSYKTYDFLQLGKVLIFLSRKLKLIPEILSSQEKQCHDKTFFYSYPNALAFVALGEISRIDNYNQKRRKFAEKYKKNISNTKLYSFPKTQDNSTNVYLRFVCFTKNPSKIIQKAKTKKIFIGDRYQQVIAPKNVNYNNAMYIIGTCPTAEKFASQSINLPCHPNLKRKNIERIISEINIIS